MANVLINENTMKSIGNSIRNKTGKAELILPVNMPTEIDSITGGGEIDKTPILTDLTNNADKTITVKDKNGKVVTMTPTYNEQGIITKLNYEGTDIPVTYDAEGNIATVGDMVAELKSFDFVPSGIEPIDHTVTFMVDDAPYEVVSVKNGNAVNAPATEPSKFSNWNNGEIRQTFPFTPKTDITLIAMFKNYVDLLYEKFNVDRKALPYVYIYQFWKLNTVAILFGNNSPTVSNREIWYQYAPYAKKLELQLEGVNINDKASVIELFLNTNQAVKEEVSTKIRNTIDSQYIVCFSNRDKYPAFDLPDNNWRPI